MSLSATRSPEKKAFVRLHQASARTLVTSTSLQIPIPFSTSSKHDIIRIQRLSPYGWRVGRAVTRSLVSFQVCIEAVLISGIHLLRRLELGPCNVTQNLTTVVNENSWNEVSNLLFISQPLGVGFSYAEELAGSINPITSEVENATFGGVTGEWAYDPSSIGTTEMAAMATWHVLQGFLSALPQLDGNVTAKTFNLWTESYGGHYGPSFYNYFYEQNALIANGSISGTPLIFDTLGIGNGLISESIQGAPLPRIRCQQHLWNQSGQ